MRKLVVAIVPKDGLRCWNASSLRAELKCLCYADNVCYENGEWHIFTRATIKVFVDRMLSQLDEFEKLFKSEESIADQETDRAFLRSLLKTKAS